MMQESKEKKENRTMSNLQKFLASYGNYVSENATVNMDVDSVLHDITANILQPNTDDEEIGKLHQKGISLKREMANDIVPKLRNLKEDKLYEIIIFIEQLNHKLNKEYEEEIKRGVDCGIYDKNQRQHLK